MPYSDLLTLCKDGDFNGAWKLLKNEPEINLSTNDNELFIATCENGHSRIAKWLLKKIKSRAPEGPLRRPGCVYGINEETCVRAWYAYIKAYNDRIAPGTGAAAASDPEVWRDSRRKGGEFGDWLKLMCECRQILSKPAVLKEASYSRNMVRGRHRRHAITKINRECGDMMGDSDDEKDLSRYNHLVPKGSVMFVFQ